MPKSKKKLVPIDPDYKPYIVLNDMLQVWVCLLDGGRTLLFSDNFEEAKILGYEEQFVHICRIADCQVMKDYI
jgi:hypothetical protein